MKIIYETYGKAEFKKSNFSTAIMYTGEVSFTDIGLIFLKTDFKERMVFRFDQLEQLEESKRGGSSDSLYD